MTKRPNILFITSDQQRGDCYGFAGRNVKTPHLDRLRAGKECTWISALHLRPSANLPAPLS